MVPGRHQNVRPAPISFHTFALSHTHQKKGANASDFHSYVVLQTIQAVSQPHVVSDLLTQAISYVQNIAATQDGIIGPDGYRRLGGNALTLKAYDANDHQLTWGVLGAALEAVRDYRAQSGNCFGIVVFKIFFWEKQPGPGSLG